MNKAISKTIALAVTMGPLAAVTAFADPWTGEGEVGYVLVSGNTNSESLNASLKLEKIQDAWKHNAKISTIRSEADDADTGESELSAKSSSAGWRSQYAFSERAFAFGDFRYFDDDFDSFEEIYTVAFGAGYSVIKEEDMTWDLSAGVGYRDTTDEVTQEDISGINYLLESDYKYTITETTDFENYTRAEINSDNNFVQNVTSLAVSISSALALKVVYDVRYNSDPSPGFESTDKIFSTNIVYKF